MIERMIRRVPVVGKLLFGQKLDATEMLKSEHMKVEGLLAQCKATRDKNRRKRIFEEIRSNLEMHAEIEEKIFYPACRQHAEIAPMIEGSYQEHQQMKDLLSELASIPADQDRFDTRFNDLFLVINHHVNDEENELFAKAKKLMSHDELVRLAGEMQAWEESHRPAKAA